MTTTVFKKKACIRCRNNFDGEGTMCDFCKDTISRQQERLRNEQPESMLLECLIERDGDTVVNVGALRYTFRRNEHGHSVCQVLNQGHYRQLLKSAHYRPYAPQAETVCECDGTCEESQPALLDGPGMEHKPPRRPR